MADSDSDIQMAVLRLIAATDAMHKTYPNTAACQSRPGLVAGHAMTPHCAWTCNILGAHDTEREEYYASRKALDELLF